MSLNDDVLDIDALHKDFESLIPQIDRHDTYLSDQDVLIYGEDGYSNREVESIWSFREAYDKFRTYIASEGPESTTVSSVKDESISVSSEISYFEAEEETEEEKEQKIEKGILIDAIKRKIIERMNLRRKNAFLHKKLIDHFKKRRVESILKKDTKGVNPEVKYLKRLFSFNECKNSQEKEIQQLTKHMEDYEMSTNSLKNQYEEKMKIFMTKAKDISLNLISTKTGKKLNDKLVDRLLKRYVEKGEEKGMKKLNYIKVKNMIEEKDAQLKTMEYFGEGLHIVDYEQMKIDNQNYTDKIEEKEDELAKMRLKTQEIIQNLAHVKEKAYAIEGDIELMEEKFFDVDLKFVATRERLTIARKKRDSLREEVNRLKSTSGLLNRDNLLKDFEKSIFDAKNLSKNLEKLRKIISEKKKKESALAKLAKGQGSSDQWHTAERKLSKTPMEDFRGSLVRYD